MPLGYEQLNEDFEAAKAAKEKAEAEQAKKDAALEPVAEDSEQEDTAA
jgi:hypothetical protein